MASLKSEISRCGLCRFYAHEGRRGGSCSQLNAPVDSKWTACSLGVSPFESGVAWESRLGEVAVCSAGTNKAKRKEEVTVKRGHWLVPETASELVAQAAIATE